MNDRFAALVLVFAAGIVVGAVGLSVSGGLAGTQNAAPELGEDPPSWFSTAGSHPANDTTRYADAGWLHEVQVDDRMVITGNASMVHDADQRLSVRVEAVGPRDYAIHLETVPDEGPTKGDGRQVSGVRWGTSIPSEYGSIELWVNGERLRIVENDDASTPRLFTLPNPLNE